LMEKSLHAGQWQSLVRGESVGGRGCMRFLVLEREEEVVFRNGVGERQNINSYARNKRRNPTLGLECE
jgi:hypothetical protein